MRLIVVKCFRGVNFFSYYAVNFFLYVLTVMMKMRMLTSRLRIFCAKSTTEMLIRSFLIGGILVFLYELKKVKNGVNRNPTVLSKNAANLSSNSIVSKYFLMSISYKYSDLFL